MQRKFSTNFIVTKQPDLEPEDAWDFDAPTHFDIKTYHETVQNKHFLDFELDPRVYTDFWFTYPHDYCDESETESKSKPSTSMSAKESIPNRDSKVNLPLNTIHKEDNKKKVLISKGVGQPINIPSNIVRRLTSPCINPVGVSKPQQKLQCAQTSTHLEMKVQASISITQNQSLIPATNNKKRREPCGGLESDCYFENGTTSTSLQQKDGRRVSYISKALKFSSYPPEETNRRLSVSDRIKIKAFTFIRNSDAHSVLNESRVTRLAPPAHRRKSKSLEKFSNPTADSSEAINSLDCSKHTKAKSKDDLCPGDCKVTQTKSIAEAKESRTKPLQTLYEPAKFSARYVRKWEKLANKQWYLLTQQERHDANTQMDQMIKQGLI